MKIQFKNAEGRVTGTATYEDGALSADTPAMQAGIDAWLLNAHDTPETFVQYFKKWTNGYASSEEVK